MSITDYKELFVWQQAIEVAKGAYKITKELPKSESYGITSQMQRAAVSIPSNIAEGYNRKTRNEYIYFLYIANGSAAELETQIIICASVYPEICFNLFLERVRNIRGLIRIVINKLQLKNTV